MFTFKALKDNLILTFQIWIFIKAFNAIEAYIMGAF